MDEKTMKPISTYLSHLRGGKTERQEISAVRQAILNKLFYTFSLIGLPAVGVGAAQSFLQGRWVFSGIYLCIYLIFPIATFGYRRFPYKVRALVLVGSLFSISLAVLVRIGMSGIGPLLMVGVCFMASVFFGVRGGIVAVLVCLASIGAVGTAMTTGWIKIHPEQMLTSVSPMAWITALFVFFMVVSVMVVAPELFAANIERSLDLLERHKNRLEVMNQELREEIREREWAEQALKRSEKKYRSVIENIQDVFYRSDEQGRLLMGSPSGPRMFGYESIDEMISLPLDHFWPDAKERQVLLDGIKKNGSVTDFEAVLKKRDGSTFHASFTTHFYHDDDGQVLGTEGIIRDITERKLAEEETQRLRNYLRNVIDSMPSVLVGVDVEGRVVQWNMAAEKRTGIPADEARGQVLDKVIPALNRQLESVKEAIAKKTVESEIKVPRHAQGETRYDDITVYPLVTNGVEGAVIRVDDVTERVRMEEMLIQSEKMLSVGGLAAGMAHQINNPLGVILQASQNVLRRVSPDLPANIRAAKEYGINLNAVRAYLEKREIPQFLEDIRKSGERAATTVSNILSFSRKADDRGFHEDLAELLEKALDLAVSDYDLKKKYDFKKIDIVREYEHDLPKVKCQASNLQQVFLNILRNGAEAMSEHRAKRQAHGEQVEPARFVLRVVKDGEMVKVEIEDNGGGMDEATRKRVFEPFFTTKSPGVGTGLGLSVSYFIIVEQHRGTFSVESDIGEGSRFIIRLPGERDRYATT